MSIRNRILGDTGFVNQAEVMDTSREAVYALKGKIEKLTKALEDSKEAFAKQRNVELNKAEDAIVAKDREIFELKKKNEKMHKELDKAKGEVAQMKKELK